MPLSRKPSKIVKIHPNDQSQNIIEPDGKTANPQSSKFQPNKVLIYTEG